MDEEELNRNLLRSRVEFTRPPANSNLAGELIAGLKRHSSRVILVDAQSGREWTGESFLDRCGALATGLVRRVGLRPNDVVMTICERADTEAIVGLAVLLAGASLYPALASDGYKEIEGLCELVPPRAMIVSADFAESARRLRASVPGCEAMKIIQISQTRPNGTHSAGEATTNGGTPAKVAYDENNNEILADSEQPPTGAGEFDFDQLIAENPYDANLIETVVQKRIRPREHVATFMLTSGSTGRPKVVPSTHEEVVFALHSMLSAARNPLGSAGPAVERNSEKQPGEKQQSFLLPVTCDDVVAGDLPLDHGAGLYIMFFSLSIGARYIVMPSYDVDAFWSTVSEHKVSFSLSSTTFGYNLFKRLRELIELGQTDRYDLSSFRLVGCCGAKLAFGDLVEQVLAHEAFTHIQVCQAYGCTENGFISMGLGWEREHMDSVGFLFPGILAKVVDYEHQERVLPPGERGEFLIFSKSLFSRYIASSKDQASAEQIFANCHDSRGEFYRTGDQAHLDSEGRIRLHGRFKDTLFLREDWKVMPAELEAVLNEHPLIETSVVVGTPDPELPGCHAPRAFVKLISPETLETRRAQLGELYSKVQANDMQFISGHIYDFFAGQTAEAKHLRGGVRIVDEFPRVGLLRKIDRKALVLL